MPGDQLTEEHRDRLIRLAERSDAIVCGPGLGNAAESLAVGAEVVVAAKKAVVDANLLCLPPVSLSTRRTQENFPGLLEQLPKSRTHAAGRSGLLLQLWEVLSFSKGLLTPSQMAAVSDSTEPALPA